MSTLESPHTTDTTHADTTHAATADAESTGATAPLPDGVEHGASVQPTILEVVAWTDPIDDAAGHDPRSDYVERFWLGLLGPSTTWLLRRFARGLDECPTGFRVNLAETGRALGLGESLARNSTTRRSIDRACQFGLAYPISMHRLAVRRTFPSLTRRQLNRLPEPLRRTHDQWVDPRLQPAHRARITAIAEGLLRRGETVGGVERLLRSWGVAHGLIHDGIVAALDALEEPDDTSAWLSLR
ncbi:MAG: hypothetical protein V9E99_12055 [Microthrixaceae bacterium]|jgi:hypothetical protein